MAIMDFFRRKKAAALPDDNVSGTNLPSDDAIAEKGQYHDHSNVPFLSMHSFFMAILVSMGGLV
jgi:hypothetical protein